MPRSIIGQVHVEDRDDWDLGDKTFEWKSGKPSHFDLLSGGKIIMAEGTPAGKYEFQVAVKDTQRNEQATGTVIVTVEDISETAFRHSGSIRIRGTTAEEFIRVKKGSSMYQRFQLKLAELLNLKQNQVHVFSVMPIWTIRWEPPIVDIRFATYGSTYLVSTQLNGLVELHRQAFEKEVGVDIIQVNVDECIVDQWETCDMGCSTTETAEKKPTVISANSTGFVGVTTRTSGRHCRCPLDPTPSACASNVCHNEGICHNTYPGIL